MKPFIYYLFQY